MDHPPGCDCSRYPCYKARYDKRMRAQDFILGGADPELLAAITEGMGMFSR